MTAHGRSVVVLGMGRSGTSVTTRVVSLLGPALCRDNDLYVAADNPTGHWESKTLTDLNDRLLEKLGGSTWLLPPPPSDPGWHETAVIRSLEEEATRSFYAVHRSTPWVWKDPRNCITWPSWRAILDEEPLPLLVFRNPLEVATSLTRRGYAVAPGHALALWERYTHDALVVAAGAPFVALDYAELVADPNGAVTALASHLANAGVEVRTEQVDIAAEFVGNAQSRPVSAALDSRDLNGAQRELIHYVHRLAGDCGVKVTREEIPQLSAAGTELLDSLRREWRAESRRVPVREAVMTSPLVIGIRKRAAVRTRLRPYIVRFR